MTAVRVVGCVVYLDVGLGAVFPEELQGALGLGGAREAADEGGEGEHVGVHPWRFMRSSSCRASPHRPPRPTR